MFTGIIEEIGTVVSVQKSGGAAKLRISAKTVLQETRIGDSVSVSGVCLTVDEVFPGALGFFVMRETTEKTALKDIAAGAKVNLERAVRADARFGGHIVSGHIDGTGRIAQIVRDGTGAAVFTIEAPPQILRYVIYKGSVALDGTSLTCMYVDSRCFKVSTIPHTLSATTLGGAKVGNNVNIECDMIGKYVEKLLLKPAERDTQGTLSLEKLVEAGF
ncbi:MAG: riboflavin synthase [Firmicutes bacterium]|nr:riboflavin synthase [Bacillota bacterium]